jgi:anti-sigma regulatory factor (Ser/Thr protein kinase)
VSSTAAQAVTSYIGVFCGRPDQVGHARHAITRHLAGHPAAADATLIISELAGNAVLHSNSAGQFFTVRASRDDTSLHLEVEDLGAPIRIRLPGLRSQAPDHTRPPGTTP